MSPLWLLMSGGGLLLYLQETGATVVSTTFTQAVLPTSFNTCLQAEVALPETLYVSPVFFCSVHCATHPSCNSFCPTETTCHLLKVAGASGVWQSGNSQSSSGVACFVPFLASRGDLALGKTVKDAGSWTNYAPGYTVVGGARCEAVSTGCYCSPLQLAPYLTVDLSTSSPVVTVVVTVSRFYPDYFTNVDIRVGDKGNTLDTLLVNYKGPASPGEVLTLTGSTTLVGRYVSLFRRGLLSQSICFCVVQVYSV